MMTGYKLPSDFNRDIERFADLIGRYKSGKISFAELKAHRVPFGIYEQRKPNTYMMRIRCAAGHISPLQLQKVAELSGEYGNSRIHITTRQEVQIHYVKLDDLITIIKQLKETGLASRGGGGNTVRNITAQEDAGISLDEAFDVSGYAVALTSRLIDEEDSWNMPRKFKIAFSGSNADRGYATITDLGFIAQVKDGKKGFKVYVAGGFGANSQEGKLLFDFIPETEVYNVAKAVKNIFFKYGNRKNKHAARLRFLWQSLGEEEFKKKVLDEYEAVKQQKYPPLEIGDMQNTTAEIKVASEESNNSQDFKLWQRRFVSAQRQQGLFSIIIPVELGFFDNAKAVRLARFLKPFGDNLIRLTKDQNFLIRNIPEKYLPNFYNFLKEVLDNFNRPLIYDKLISCAGASTCQLGICLSRGAAKAIMRMFDKSKLDLDRFSDLKINISGCPNACGQHPAADLGFFGKAARKEGKLYPAYNVVAAARVKNGQIRFAQKAAEVSARDIAGFSRDFLKAALSKLSEYRCLKDYTENRAIEDLKEIEDSYKAIPDFESDKNYYFDWGSDKAFSLAARGAGECSAGLFDLIEVDRDGIKKAKEKLLQISEGNLEAKQDILLQIAFHSSRMLLISRGLEPATEEDVYNAFCEHFIDTGLVDKSFRELVELAKNKNRKALSDKQDKIKKLADRVELLYQSMDNSFQFKIPGELKEKPLAAKPKIFKDLRGVACPMNFVKTKIELAKIRPKDILEVWLDEGEPIDNVPPSVKAEGHKIIEQKKIDNYWSVVIEKA